MSCLFGILHAVGMFYFHPPTDSFHLHSCTWILKMSGHCNLINFMSVYENCNLDFFYIGKLCFLELSAYNCSSLCYVGTIMSELIIFLLLLL